MPENGVEKLSEQQLTEMLRFANAAVYPVNAKKGAIRSMPEIENCADCL